MLLSGAAQERDAETAGLGSVEPAAVVKAGLADPARPDLPKREPTTAAFDGIAPRLLGRAPRAVTDWARAHPDAFK